MSQQELDPPLMLRPPPVLVNPLPSTQDTWQKTGSSGILELVTRVKSVGEVTESTGPPADPPARPRQTEAAPHPFP